MQRAKGRERMRRRVYFGFHEYGHSSLSRLLTIAREARTWPQMDRVYTRLDRLKDRLVERREALENGRRDAW